MKVIFVVLSSLVLGSFAFADGDLSAEAALAKAEKAFRRCPESDYDRGLSTLYGYACHGMKMPKAFSGLEKQRLRYVAAGKYREASQIAARMEKLIPANYPVGFPMAGDFLIGWHEEVAQLMALGNDYKGAAKEFERAMAMTISEGGFDLSQSAWKQTAAFRLARVYVLLGRGDEGEAVIEKAPGLCTSHCGMANASTRFFAIVLKSVYKTASLPPPQAKKELARILAGRVSFAPCDRMAQTEASFMLGELSLRTGDRALAKRAFKTAVAGGGETGKMAASRLRSL